MKDSQNIKGSAVFMFLLLILYMYVSGLHDFLASDSAIFGAIKSYISLAAQFPEEYGDLLTSADKWWATIGAYCQTSTCVVGIVSFLIGIIVMYWINKMGKRESFKHILKYIVFVAVIILVVEFIFHFLSK